LVSAAATLMFAPRLPIMVLRDLCPEARLRPPRSYLKGDSLAQTRIASVSRRF